MGPELENSPAWRALSLGARKRSLAKLYDSLEGLAGVRNFSSNADKYDPKTDAVVLSILIEGRIEPKKFMDEQVSRVVYEHRIPMKKLDITVSNGMTPRDVTQHWEDDPCGGMPQTDMVDFFKDDLVEEEIEDMSLEARVQRKLKILKGSKEPPPEKVTRWTLQNNVLNARAMHARPDDGLLARRYRIQFVLNGESYEVETRVTRELMDAAGSRNAIVAAMSEGLSKQIAQALIQKLIDK